MYGTAGLACFQFQPRLNIEYVDLLVFYEYIPYVYSIFALYNVGSARSLPGRSGNATNSMNITGIFL
jgi:hypothetical protein